MVQPLADFYPKSTGRPSILLVEDERISRQALTWLLTSSGFQTESYGSAEEALHAAEEYLPPLALVDVDLPGMSGLELVKRLRARFPTLRVVLLTAVTGERISRFQKEHVVGYVRKPIDFPHLLEILDRFRPHDQRQDD